MMFDHLITFLLILLIMFTPLAWGSMEFWAFSVMELGILLLIVLWAVSQIHDGRIRARDNPSATGPSLTERTTWNLGWTPATTRVALILLGLFLGLALLQKIDLPASWVSLLSPKTGALREQLHLGPEPLRTTCLSFFPLGTRTELLKWLILSGFFLFVLRWRPDRESRVIHRLLLTIFFMGVFEAFYGLFGFFGIRNHLIELDEPELIYSAGGTFINRNHFAGYLLMVIPLSIGFLFSREAKQKYWPKGLLQRLSSLNGKALLISFGIIVMILGLLFSASRMGIVSLLLSFSLTILLVRDRSGQRTFSKRSALLLGLALIWGVWIGLDAVIGRFFGISEDFELRWKIWTNTLQIIKDFPLFGAGLGTFTQVFPMYRSFPIRGLVTHAENDFLQLASETGLLGFGLLLALFIILFFKAASRIRSFSPGEPRRYIAIGGLVGILALMFHSQVERNVQVPANAFLYTMLWGWVLREPPQVMEEKGEEKKEWT